MTHPRNLAPAPDRNAVLTKAMLRAAERLGLSGRQLAELARLVAILAGAGDASPMTLISLGLGLIGLRDRIERGFRGDA